jgi:hypothetical protein
LRGEVVQLRRVDTEKTELQATNALLRARVTKANQQLAAAQALPNYWPREQIAYAGLNDPESAMRSLLATMNSSDANSMRAILSPKLIGGMDKEMEKEGFTQMQKDDHLKQMSAMMLDGVEGYHIVSEIMNAPDEAVMKMSFDGQNKTRTFIFKKVDNEWRLDNLLLQGEFPLVPNN